MPQKTPQNFAQDSAQDSAQNPAFLYNIYIIILYIIYILRRTSVGISLRETREKRMKKHVRMHRFLHTYVWAYADVCAGRHIRTCRKMRP